MDSNPDVQMSIQEPIPKLFVKDSFPRREHPSFNLQQTIKEEPILNYSYYVNACFNIHLPYLPNGDVCHQTSDPQTRTLPASDLREAMTEMELSGYWNVQETAFGLVMAFERKDDAEEVFEKLEIAKVLGGPVQVATLPNIQTGNGSRGTDRKNFTYNNGRYNPVVISLSVDSNGVTGGENEIPPGRKTKN